MRGAWRICLPTGYPGSWTGESAMSRAILSARRLSFPRCLGFRWNFLRSRRRKRTMQAIVTQPESHEAKPNISMGTSSVCLRLEVLLIGKG